MEVILSLDCVACGFDAIEVLHVEEVELGTCISNSWDKLRLKPQQDISYYD
jgi:hypothetical protein